MRPCGQRGGGGRSGVKGRGVKSQISTLLSPHFPSGSPFRSTRSMQLSNSRTFPGRQRRGEGEGERTGGRGWSRGSAYPSRHLPYLYLLSSTHFGASTDIYRPYPYSSRSFIYSSEGQRDLPRAMLISVSRKCNGGKHRNEG